MKRTVSMILAICMLAALCLTAGCKEAAGPATAAPAAPAAPAAQDSGGAAAAPAQAAAPAEPSRTDINLAGVAIVTTDPQGTTVSATVQMHRWVSEGLVFVTDDIEVEPRIAKSWEVSADGTEYTFTLEDKAKFHSGSPVTVDDVVYSLERAIDLSYMKNFVVGMVNVEGIGSDKVKVTLEAPNSAFFINLAQIGIVEKAICEKMGEGFGTEINNATTGPYKIVSYDPNVKVVLERFEDYYRELPGNIQTINYNVITDNNTKLIAYETGELDFIEVPAANWPEISADSKYTSMISPGTKVQVLILSWSKEGSPLNDVRVRQALAYAVNRDAVNQITFGGLGTIAKLICRPGYIKGSVENDALYPGYSYNPEKAKELLAEAGYNQTDKRCKLGIFLVPNASGAPSTAPVVQQNFADVGIDVTIEQAESSSASAMSKDWYQDVYITTSNMIQQMSTIKRMSHSTSAATSVPKYNSLEMDSYLENAEHALTDEEMLEWYGKANEYIYKACIHIPMVYVNYLYSWDKNLNATPGIYYNDVQNWYWN